MPSEAEARAFAERMTYMIKAVREAKLVSWDNPNQACGACAAFRSAARRHAT